MQTAVPARIRILNNFPKGRFLRTQSICVDTTNGGFGNIGYLYSYILLYFFFICAHKLMTSLHEFIIAIIY